MQEDLTSALPEDAPLAAVRRGALIESVHRGRFAACDPTGDVLDSSGDPEGYAYIRSCAKPFQAIPLLLSGVAEAFGFTDEELAVACASHSGEERHVSLVRSILEKAGLSEESLQNGPHPPFHGPSAQRLARSGEAPSSVHGNCSGKHAGMLALCVHERWGTEDYRDPQHPAQRRILEVVTEVCGLRQDEVLLGGDGCGVPSFAMPLKNLATGFARLISGDNLPGELSEACGQISRIMRENPYLIAGTGRFDTDLVHGSELLVKGGAEGMFACGSPSGWGLTIKVTDGSGRAVRPAALSVLSRRGVETALKENASLLDLHGESVGEVFPLS